MLRRWLVSFLKKIIVDGFAVKELRPSSTCGYDDATVSINQNVNL